MNARFLAVVLWALAWLLIDVAAIAAIGFMSERKRALAAGTVIGGGFAAAVLINAGTDLW